MLVRYGRENAVCSTLGVGMPSALSVNLEGKHFVIRFCRLSPKCLAVLCRRSSL